MPKRARDEEDDEAAAPAYNIGTSQGAAAGPSCSAHPHDFCFLCEFSKLDCGDTNYVQEIEDLVTQLAREKKELPVIARAVSRAYREGAQQFVQWENPRTGATVDRPAWSIEAISRHLLFSKTWEPLFQRTLGFVFERIIHEEQSRVVNPATGAIKQEMKYHLLKTIAAYADWQVKMAKVKGSAA